MFCRSYGVVVVAICLLARELSSALARHLGHVFSKACEMRVLSLIGIILKVQE